MAIEFNAGTGANTGTIAGLAVGGLPSGIIDADTVADSSIALAKTAFGGGVKLKHLECIKYSTRTAGFGYISTNSPNTYTTFVDVTYDKQFSNTTLLTHWLIHGYGGSGAGASNLSAFVENDADTSINQRILNPLFPYSSSGSFQIVCNGTAHFTTILPTGNCSLKLQCNNPSSVNTARPTQVINPNSTEDSRLGSGGLTSSILVMEVLP
jgi:hypothetical protein